MFEVLNRLQTYLPQEVYSSLHIYIKKCQYFFFINHRRFGSKTLLQCEENRWNTQSEGSAQMNRGACIKSLLNKIEIDVKSIKLYSSQLENQVSRCFRWRLVPWHDCKPRIRISEILWPTELKCCATKSKNRPHLRSQDSLNWSLPWIPSPLTTNTIVKSGVLQWGASRCQR